MVSVRARPSLNRSNRTFTTEIPSRPTQDPIEKQEKASATHTFITQTPSSVPPPQEKTLERNFSITYTSISHVPPPIKHPTKEQQGPSTDRSIFLPAELRQKILLYTEPELDEYAHTINYPDNWGYAVHEHRSKIKDWATVLKEAEPNTTDYVDFVVEKWRGWYEEDLQVLDEEWWHLCDRAGVRAWRIGNQYFGIALGSRVRMIYLIGEQL